jgi:hypothetical protein
MLEFLTAFFALGTIWFWLTASMAFCGIVYFSETGANLFAGLIVVIFAFLFFSGNDINFSIVTTIAAIFIYALFGGLWSVVKWYSYLRQHMDKFIKLRTAWVHYIVNTKDWDNTITPITSNTDDWTKEQQKQFKIYLYDNGMLTNTDTKISTIIPKWRNESQRMLFWIIWWPASLVWTFLNDPVKRTAKFIWKGLGSAYDNMAAVVFKKVNINQNTDW